MTERDWVYWEDDATGIGGDWHAKAYSLRRGETPGEVNGQTALSVGYDASTTGEYEVSVFNGVWTDATEDSEGFVEGVQDIFDRGRVAEVGTYRSEEAAQAAMTAFTTLVSARLVGMGESWGGDETTLPQPHADARRTVRENREPIEQLAAGE